MEDSRPKSGVAIATIIRKVIKCLRERGPQKVYELARELDATPEQVCDWAKQFPAHSRVKFEEARAIISFEPISEEVTDQAGLLEYLRKHPDGVIEDDSLLDSYFGLKADLVDLEKKHTIRFLAGKDKKKLIFPREEQVFAEVDLELLCPKEVKEMWDSLDRRDVERKANSRG